MNRFRLVDKGLPTALVPITIELDDGLTAGYELDFWFIIDGPPGTHWVKFEVTFPSGHTTEAQQNREFTGRLLRVGITPQFLEPLAGPYRVVLTIADEKVCDFTTTVNS